ncbi:MmgE/PrpD family protein [Xylophilus rhododendri]|uniref:MmgE/PrpD family protein n=1 Tax=Xylophilus rhododendri TaxID=2697032 RepID=A0A857J5P1_9BURK|nr:MmgE/PrpD family protein [Xylophilus rhododendri]QHI98311.1 MmgE/PrpD family protein [Xylophilus rhododendri]
MTSQASSSASARLAAFACAAEWDDIPEPVRHEARRSLMNYCAVALGGSHDPTIEAAVRTFTPLRSGTQARLAGRAERFDPLNAAALNAMAANVYDFCDTHIPTILHPSAPVFPPLLALADQAPVHGRELLLAFVVGAEVECRIANAISPWHYARGWHITSTCGVFGAAAGVARLKRLDAAVLASAFGSAAAQSCGLVETLGSSAKSISVGNAARNGLLSVLLALEGFEGPAAPLDGPRGFLRVVCDQPDFSKLDGGDPAWQLLANAYKPYPCGVVLNPVIDACLALAADPAFAARAPETIESMELTGHPLLRQRTDRPGVTSGRQSQVSAQHAVPVSLLRRRAGLEEFSDAAVQDPAVRSLGAKVRFTDDDTMTVDAARVRIRYADGSELQHSVEFARGSLGRPLTDAELEQKLRELARYSGAAVDTAALIDAVWLMDQTADASALMALTASAGPCP